MFEGKRVGINNICYCHSAATDLLVLLEAGTVNKSWMKSLAIKDEWILGAVLGDNTEKFMFLFIHVKNFMEYFDISLLQRGQHFCCFDSAVSGEPRGGKLDKKVPYIFYFSTFNIQKCFQFTNSVHVDWYFYSAHLTVFETVSSKILCCH